MKKVLIVVPQKNELEPLLAAFDRRTHPPRSERIGIMECFAIPSLAMIAERRRRPLLCAISSLRRVRYLLALRPRSSDE